MVSVSLSLCHYFALKKLKKAGTSPQKANLLDYTNNLYQNRMLSKSLKTVINLHNNLELLLT